MSGRLTDFTIEICWKNALDTGASVLALNVIEAAHPSQSLKNRRSELNTLIANHREDRWSVLLLIPFPARIAKVASPQVLARPLLSRSILRVARGEAGARMG